ncbi:substrate-binding periplasmic protein [Psychromonas algarum]|uniref:substrate-binding periplasmic protein n=1 Tax=Psychromonas algarum TaxID=2555643 RepID=UPI00141A0CDF|nr:ABC transporter substrate-binding protein [Psychromonas sp. RZ22]
MKPISAIFKTLMVALLAVTTLSLPAYAKDKDKALTIKKDKLIVGMTGEQPPFNFVSTENMIIGYDVALASYLADEMKLELVIEVMPFSELLPALDKGKVDIVMSNMAVTKDRQKQVLFSASYALAAKSILTTKKNITRIYQTTGFNHENVKLVALAGSTSAELTKDRLAEAKLSTVEHYEDGVLAVLSGKADAMVADLAVCELLVHKDTTHDLTLLRRPIGTEKIAVALAKDNDALQKEINLHLITFSDEGGLEALHQKWFNEGSWLSLVP